MGRSMSAWEFCLCEEHEALAHGCGCTTTIASCLLFDRNRSAETCLVHCRVSVEMQSGLRLGVNEGMISAPVLAVFYQHRVIHIYEERFVAF